MAAAAILNFGVWTLTTATVYLFDINRPCDISNKCSLFQGRRYKCWKMVLSRGLWYIRGQRSNNSKMTCETQAMCMTRVQWIYSAFWLSIIVKDYSDIDFQESDSFQNCAKVLKFKMAAAAILDFGIRTLKPVTFYLFDINRPCDTSNKCSLFQGRR